MYGRSCTIPGMKSNLVQRMPAREQNVGEPGEVEAEDEGQAVDDVDAQDAEAQDEEQNVEEVEGFSLSMTCFAWYTVVACSAIVMNARQIMQDAAGEEQPGAEVEAGDQNVSEPGEVEAEDEGQAVDDVDAQDAEVQDEVQNVEEVEAFSLAMTCFAWYTVIAFWAIVMNAWQIMQDAAGEEQPGAEVEAGDQNIADPEEVETEDEEEEAEGAEAFSLTVARFSSSTVLEEVEVEGNRVVVGEDENEGNLEDFIPSPLPDLPNLVYFPRIEERVEPSPSPTQFLWSKSV